MPTTAPLAAADREFFRNLADLVFTNPFSTEGEAAARRYASGATDRESIRRHYLNAIVSPLNERIGALERAGHSSLQAFRGEDRRLLEHAFLFQVYFRFVDELDALILDQADNNEPVAVPFAEQVLALLKTRGFSDRDCTRYLGLFYQLRRAYYFIVKSLVGEAPCMRQLRCELWNNVFTYDVRLYDQHLFDRMEDFSTLLLGETGTGKGAAAAAIGRSAFIPYDAKRGRFAESFNQSFLAINLSQYPEALIESELFGHKKGAFTGAVEEHAGVFARCSAHGALFLDEIGDVSVPVQIKLLQVIQERRFTPVGSHKAQRFSGRVIAATNRSLGTLRREGKFRDDFYYRLCSDVITVPPLRQRVQESADELQRLVELLVTRMTGAAQAAVTELVMTELKRTLPNDYAWPGNVRELEQAVRRILLTRRYQGDVTGEPGTAMEQLSAKMNAGELNARELLSHYCTHLYQRFGSYEDVARRTDLDRRTVKKYIEDLSG
jgi:DNA-binding NtrC family response regulator